MSNCLKYSNIYVKSKVYPIEKEQVTNNVHKDSIKSFYFETLCVIIKRARTTVDVLVEKCV